MRSTILALAAALTLGFTGVLACVASPLVGIMLAVAGGVVGVLVMHYTAPRMAREAWAAEEANGVIVMLHMINILHRQGIRPKGLDSTLINEFKEVVNAIKKVGEASPPTIIIRARK